MSSLVETRVEKKLSLPVHKQGQYNPPIQSAVAVVDFKEPLQIIPHYPKPEIENPYEVIVKNKAIGINPIDWKGHRYKFGIYHFPWINGRESSGIVVEAGAKVDRNLLGEGASVLVASTSYRDNRTSTFQEYVAIDSRLIWRLPDNLDFTSGASVGVGLVTAAVILTDSFGLDLEPHSQAGKTLLVWGGATVVGLYLTQLAQFLGLKVISVAGLKNEDYLKKLGASAVIDRNKSTDEVIEEVKQLTNQVEFGVDCASKESAEQVTIVLDALHREGSEKPKFAGIVSVPKNITDAVDKKDVVIKRFHEDIKFGQKIVALTSKLLHNGQVKPVKCKVFTGGLETVIDALNALETEGAAAERYVVKLE